MKKIKLLLMVVVLIVSLAGCGSSEKTKDNNDSESNNQVKTEKQDEVVTINYYGKPDTDFEKKVIEDFEKEYSNIKVNYVELAGGSNEKLTTIQTVLQSKDSTIDVFAADVTWPSIFIAAGWVAPLDDLLKEDIDKGLLDEYISSALGAFQNNNLTYGLPYISNAGTLYYRKDLLDKYEKVVPTTWKEVVETAKYILEQEKNPDLVGYGSAWKQSEGLTCTVMEHFWDQDVYIYKNGKVDLDKEKIQTALQGMYDMIYTDGVALEATPTFGNSDVREIMQTGNLIFSRDWISQAGKFMDPEINTVAEHVGIAPVPGGSSLGVWGLMISEYSEHKEEAALFLKYRASKMVQIEQASAIHQLPAAVEAFHDSSVIEVFPAAKELLQVMNSGEPRPLTPFYGEVSSIIQVETHSMLTKGITPEEAAANIVQRVSQVID